MWFLVSPSKCHSQLPMLICIWEKKKPLNFKLWYTRDQKLVTGQGNIANRLLRLPLHQLPSLPQVLSKWPPAQLRPRRSGRKPVPSRGGLAMFYPARQGNGLIQACH